MKRARKKEEREFFLLGRRLAGARRERGMTQKAVADHCGLLQSDVSKIEQGRRAPSVPHLVKLAQMLEVPLQWFLTGKRRPGMELRDVAIELHHLGLVDLRVPDARVPGAFRPPEDILAWVMSGDRPDPRIVEAIPAVLAWNAWNPRLLEAYGYTYDPRAAYRLAWLADVALTIHHNHVFPGGFVDPLRVSEFMRRIRPPEEVDDLGYPAGNERLPPVSKRWNIGYAAALTAFHGRAKHLLPLWIEANGSSDGCGNDEHG
jgi:transcriptional regulator with XRE-family HTH domain